MSKYALPPDRPTGPKVADLIGRLLAIQPIDVGERDTKFGTKLVAVARVVEIDIEGGTIELGTVAFAQVVLADDLRRIHEGDHGWLVARIVQPDKALLFQKPDQDDQPAIDKAMASLTDDEPF